MQIQESFSGEINGFSTKQNLRWEQLETSLSLMSPLLSMELHVEQERGGLWPEIMALAEVQFTF